MKESRKSKKKDIEVTSLSGVAAEDQKVTRFPHIKRMLATLDKFMDRRIAGIAMFFCAAIAACGIGIFINGEVANASSGGGGGGMNSTNALLYSLLAVLCFAFVLIVTRVVTVRHTRKKLANNKTEEK